MGFQHIALSATVSQGLLQPHFPLPLSTTDRCSNCATVDHPSETLPLFSGGISPPKPTAPDRAAAGPFFLRPGTGLPRGDGASGAFAAWVGPTGFVRLALAAFEGEILAGGEGFVDMTRRPWFWFGRRDCRSEFNADISEISFASTARRRNSNSGSASNRAPAPYYRLERAALRRRCPTPATPRRDWRRSRRRRKSPRPASASRLCRKRSASANDAGISADGSPVRRAWLADRVSRADGGPRSPACAGAGFFRGCHGVLDRTDRWR